LGELSFMPKDAFISYEHNDKRMANAICDALESKGIQCWIAPRDILPGMDYAEALIQAIDEIKIMVLVFSSNTNDSSHVRREVNRAFSKENTIIPFFIDDSKPSGAMEYYLNGPQWIVASEPPLEKHLDRLTDTINKYLSKKSKASAPTSVSPVLSIPSIPEIKPEPNAPPSVSPLPSTPPTPEIKLEPSTSPSVSSSPYRLPYSAPTPAKKQEEKVPSPTPPSQPTPEPFVAPPAIMPTPPRSGPKTILAVIIVAFVLICMAVALFGGQNPQNPIVPTPTITPAPTPSERAEIIQTTTPTPTYIPTITPAYTVTYTPTIPVSGFSTYDNPALGFSVLYPSTWTIYNQPTSADSQHIAFESRDGNTGMLVDANGYQGTPPSLDYLTNSTIESTAATFNPCTLLETKRTTFAGYPAQYFRYILGGFSSGPREYDEYELIVGQTWYHTAFWMLTNPNSDTLSIEQQMFNSFEFIT